VSKSPGSRIIELQSDTDIQTVMNKQTLLVVATLLAVLFSNTAIAASREEQRVGDAVDVLEQLLRIPERTVPPALLSQAYAVAVIPKVMKAAVGLGVRRGKGIIVVRQDDDSWSNPAFVTITGGSVGWQIGAQSTDIILVFKSRKGVEGIENGRLTLGADAAVAAGPVGRLTGVATDIKFKAEVYSYSRNRGLFAGVSLEGASVTMDRKANAAFYDANDMTPERIFVSSPNIAPNVANTFVQILTAQTSNLPKLSGMTANRPVPAPEEESEVRTFGLPDEDSSDDEYIPNY
jgi:lipid-binding SYLF domain-containing protein